MLRRIAYLCRRRGHLQLVALTLAALTPTASALAMQTSPTREQLTPPLPQSQPSPEAAVTSERAAEGTPCLLASAEYADVRFTLDRVIFSGGAAIDPALLDASWAGLRGQSLQLAAICDIRDRAAALLRARGFLAAVLIPEQTISTGQVQLDILAARLTRVQVRGDAGSSEPLLARYLRKLEGQPLFNQADAERALLLAREIPGLDARLALRPGASAGELVGEVTVRRSPLFLDFNVQNFGNRDVGPIGVVARARFNGLTGLGDQTSLSLYSTGDAREQRIAQLSHEMRLGGDGLTLGASLTHARTHPDLPALPVRSRTRISSLTISYPAILRQTERLVISGGIDVVDQDIRLGGAPLNRDRLRALHLRAEHRWVDAASVAGRGGFNSAEPRWMAASTTEWRRGLAGLGASDPCGPAGAACFLPGVVPPSRIEGRADALLMRWYGHAEWRPHPQFALVLHPRAQWANAPLLSYDEFSAGNFTVGRGYDPGALLGDSGVAVIAEARLKTLIPQNRSGVAAQPFLFVDAAWVWNKDTTFAGVGAQSLFSAGGGVRIAYGDVARLDLALAAPLKRLPLAAQRGNPRLLITLTTLFGAGSR